MTISRSATASRLRPRSRSPKAWPQCIRRSSATGFGSRSMPSSRSESPGARIAHPRSCVGCRDRPVHARHPTRDRQPLLSESRSAALPGDRRHAFHHDRGYRPAADVAEARPSAKRSRRPPYPHARSGRPPDPRFPSLRHAARARRERAGGRELRAAADRIHVSAARCRGFRLGPAGVQILRSRTRISPTSKPAHAIASKAAMSSAARRSWRG